MPISRSECGGKTHVTEFVPVFALVVLGHGAHPLLIVQGVTSTAAGDRHRQHRQRHEQTETQRHLNEKEREITRGKENGERMRDMKRERGEQVKLRTGYLR